MRRVSAEDRATAAGRALGLAAALLCACGPGPSAQEGPAAQPQVALHGVRLRAYKGDTLFSSGRAAKVIYYRQTADFRAQEARMRFPARGEAETGQTRVGGSGYDLSAPLASGNLPTRKVVGEGGVHLRTDRGMQGRSPSVFFDGQREMAQGPGPIFLRGPDYNLDGQAFSFDLANEVFEFDGGVRSRFGEAP